MLKKNTQRIIQRTCATIADSATAKTTASNAANGVEVQRFPPDFATIAGLATAKTTAAFAANGAEARKFQRLCATTVDSATVKTTAAGAANGRREVNVSIKR